MVHLDLFSGIGGFALACEWAGIETIGFVEIDKYCQKVLRKHWPDVPIVEDIKDVKEDTFPKSVDIVTSGDPCQPFSIAGKRKGTADDRYLWGYLFKVLQIYKPTWFVGENVTAIFGMELDNRLSQLEHEGYETQAFIIPACSVGARHLRNRAWVLAYSESSRQLRLSNEMANLKESKPEKRWLWESSVKSLVADLGFCPNSDDWRATNGFPDWVDRLKCLGNAIVPQVAYEIIMAIRRSE